LLLPLLLGVADGAPAAGASHPPVAAREGCVTLKCHARLLAPDPAARGRSVHQPAADGDCAACHDLAIPAGTRFVKGAPGGAAGAGRADAWDLALCSGCHDEALAARDAPAGTTGFTDGRKNLHALHVQAARGPRCLPCHDPHAATQPLLLRSRIPARGGVVIPQEFRAEANGGWCRTGCHAPKSYRR
jgi:predicted CXXCH cytochrome family protein